MRPKIAFIAALVCIVLSGCGLPDRNAKRQVAVSEVVGTWKLTPASLALLKRDGFVVEPGNAYVITFNADGTLEFASVYDAFEGIRYLDADGRWTLEHNTTGGSNIRKTNVLSLVIKEEQANNHDHLNFAERDDKLILWSYYGDPDSWEFIEYERDP